MGEIILFPIRIRPTDYWKFYEPWARGGYWQSCTNCRRADCFRAGKGFIACAYHTENPSPPAPYDYGPDATGPV